MQGKPNPKRTHTKAPRLSRSGARAAATSPALVNTPCHFSNSYLVSLLLNLTHRTVGSRPTRALTPEQLFIGRDVDYRCGELAQFSVRIGLLS